MVGDSENTSKKILLNLFLRDLYDCLNQLKPSQTKITFTDDANDQQIANLICDNNFDDVFKYKKDEIYKKMFAKNTFNQILTADEYCAFFKGIKDLKISEDEKNKLLETASFILFKKLLEYNDANLITDFFTGVYKASISSNEGEADKSQDFLSQALKSLIKASKKIFEKNNLTYLPTYNIELYKQALSVIKDDDKKIDFGIKEAEFYIGKSQEDDNEYGFTYYSTPSPDSYCFPYLLKKDYSNSFGQAFYSSTSNIDFDKVAERVSKMDSNKDGIGDFIDGFKSGLRQHEIIDNVSMGLALGLGFGACATALGVGIVATAPAIAVVASTALIGATVGAGIGYVVSEVKASKITNQPSKKIK
jgi:hypothetical protein